MPDTIMLTGDVFGRTGSIRMLQVIQTFALVCGIISMSELSVADEFRLSLRAQTRATADNQFICSSTETTWASKETAIIVCDVWDKHHSLNAVRRMEEFLPRMNDVLKTAREQGATIIHSPSDCMPAYEDHPARLRAIAVPKAKNLPVDMEFWCSKIPAEEQAVYPIDQSDGGEDDDSLEHAQWASDLSRLGRNPELPWQKQNDMIEIRTDSDYISDRGDEVWNILESRGIKNVILVGVHTNMCVLGRPFGLRQMVRNGKNVVLMRDLTDCMYNPQRWPYVDHFTGNDLIIAHVERFVCPTITSEQIVGGDAFRSSFDRRDERDFTDVKASRVTAASFKEHWSTAEIGNDWMTATGGTIQKTAEPSWFRCSIRLPQSWLSNGNLTLKLDDETRTATAWLNGTPLTSTARSNELEIPADAVAANDINLLVVRFDHKDEQSHMPKAPQILGKGRSLPLAGRWQFRLGEGFNGANIPLPAKFGIGPDVLYEAK
jgi:nicotinamidase-related amidase